MLKDFNQAPDLVVDQLTVGSDGVTVVIKNIGGGPVVDGFWVDVYLNPTAPPTYNQPWQKLAAEGLVWGVTQPIPAGGALTLTLGDAFYAPKHSRFSGTIAPGTPVWAQVDSINLNTNYGGVLESHEGNNVTGPVSGPTGAASTVPSVSSQEPLPSDHLLPAR